MHVPQSAASDIVQQNETCIVTSLNTDYTNGFIKKNSSGGKNQHNVSIPLSEYNAKLSLRFS
jgi:hypothetical protein